MRYSIYLTLSTTIIFIFFVILFLGASFYISRMTPSFIRPEGNKLIEVYKGKEIKQNFKPGNDNINMVFVRLKNPSLRNIDQFILTVEEEKKVLREVNISGRNIGDDEWVKFQFEPINNVSNKGLELHLSSVTNNLGNTLYVYSNDRGEISIKVYSKQAYWYSLLSSLSKFKNSFMQDVNFVILYLAIIVISLTSFKKIKHIYG